MMAQFMALVLFGIYRQAMLSSLARGQFVEDEIRHVNRKSHFILEPTRLQYMIA
jgi:hypothetical protein